MKIFYCPKKTLQWLVLASGLTGLLTACPSSPAEKPVITQFIATANQIQPGGSSSLQWTVTGATSLSLDQGLGDVSGKTSQNITPTSNTSYTLTATNAAGSSSASTSVSILAANTPSSNSLIADALTKGQIIAEQALEYKVFAAFGDDRLPLAYKGTRDDGISSSIMSEITSKFDSLSDAAKAVVFPFFLPPVYPESAYSQRNRSKTKMARAQGSWPPPTPYCSSVNDAAWSFKENPSGHVKVWYATASAGLDAAKAQLVANELDTVIWSKLIDTLGMLAPLSDALTPCSGGDERLDVYLAAMETNALDSGNLGETERKYISLNHSSVFILVDHNLNGDKLKGVLAHELMHASNWAYNGKGDHQDYGWLNDASANWAIEYVYRSSVNVEHGYPAFYLSSTEKSLDDATAANKRAYGEYLFPFFLDKTINPNLIPAIWNQTLSFAKPDDAVNAAIPGGLDKQWEKFTRRNWNGEWNSSPNGEESYLAWDGISDQPNSDPLAVDLQGNQDGEKQLSAELPNLSIRYYKMTFPDLNARSIVFYNGLTYKLSEENLSTYGLQYPDGKAYVASDITADQRKGLKVQALLKIGGVWQAFEDWTDKPYATFCRDKSTEKLEELVLIFSNSSFDSAAAPIKPQGLDPTLQISNVGCAHVVQNGDIVGVNTTGNSLAPNVKITTTGFSGDGGALMLEENGKHAFVGYGFPTLTGGTQIEESGTDSVTGCAYSGGISKPLSLTTGLVVYTNLLSGAAYRAYALNSFMLANHTVSQQCPNASNNPPPEQVLGFNWGPLIADPFQKVDAAGNTITANGLVSSEDYTFNMKLEFTTK